MKANYNSWFYSQHKYRKSKRNGVESFNDTKWVNDVDRLRTLVDMESELLSEQPSLVRANNKGFDMLLDLLGRSNYTFEDLSESLKETYRTSLKQAMSYNMVNTHAIIFHTNKDNRRNVYVEKFSHYRIIDVPFDQLHFGHRDEFIRQKLHEMHVTANDYYIDIDKFNTSEISDVLDFCILCTVNGYISNDCKVAVDDHGFKFKIGWKSDNDVDFIVYKLDKCKVFKALIPVGNDMSLISYSDLGIKREDVEGLKCLVNIYNERYKDSIHTVPNFGIFNDKGLSINGLQKATTNMINNLNMKSVNVTIYALKFFFEVPNIFPAVNYYEIMENKLVYDEKYERLKTPEGETIVESTYSDDNELEICTPPITIDRDTSYTFNTIVKCLTLQEKLMKYKPTLIKLGKFFAVGEGDMLYYNTSIKPELNQVVLGMTTLINDYKEGALVTSLVSSQQVKLFDKLYANVKNVYYNFSDYSEVQEKFVFDELYGNNYDDVVKKICKPFKNEKLQQFSHALNIPNNFFEYEDVTRFNHPISEQCFITLEYSDDEQSWLFAYPTINHFHGIGNTFYVNEDLTGNEIFKFFVLYTDTMDPMNKYIEHFDFDTVIDFDLFYTEMSKYTSCIRYWDAESKIAKMSKILYGKYDDETCVHVLSRILKRKLDGKSILDDYMSEINYEESNATSDNVEGYDEDTYRAPMSVNFLFYTLSMMNGNIDKLQAYFYRHLTNSKYSNRYVDVDINTLIDGDEKYGISFSSYCISPIRISSTEIVKPEGNGPLCYYGYPMITDHSGEPLYAPYRFVLNTYEQNKRYSFVGKNGIDSRYYNTYREAVAPCTVVTHEDTIEMAKLVAEYVDEVYDCIADMQNNYKSSYDVTLPIDRAFDTLNALEKKIYTVWSRHNFDNIDLDPGYIDGTYTLISTQLMLNMIISPHSGIPHLNAITEFEDLKETCEEINAITFDTPTTINAFINGKLLKTLKYVYKQTGFDANINDRVVALYKHLRKINQPMNAYVFKKWLSEIDLHTLSILDQHIAYDPDYEYSPRMFEGMSTTLSTYITRVTPLLDYLSDKINELTTVFDENVTIHMVNFVYKVLTQIVFDMYICSSITSTNLASATFSVQPVYAVIQLPEDAHTNPPYGQTLPGDKYITLYVNSYMSGNNFKISSFSNIAENVFFNGTTLNGLTITVLDENGSSIGTITNATMEFTQVCSTADRGEQFNYLPNVSTTVVDFENHHESFDIYQDKIINEKTAEMNYELLIGNNFTQLDHESEYILNPTDWNPGSIDRIVIDNQMINKMCILDHAHKNCVGVYFKPCHVYHDKYNVNGKYFEGERVYAKTDDGYIFPITVTSVDHSINKGFMEAKVDQWDATWMLADTNEKIDTYMNNIIECEVIDDSIRNFLDEYSNEELMTFYNPGYDNESYVMDDKHETCYILPGDPIYVTSNAPFVYTRLNWMFNEDVPNRFIDEDHKQYRFIYVGKGFINDLDGIKINMINHNFNNLTLPEKYPILRDEPNDHVIRRKEVEIFQTAYNELVYGPNGANALTNQITYLENVYEHTDDYYQRKNIRAQITELEYRRTMANERAKMYEDLIAQPENATTWYNVLSNDAALVYIENGRATSFSPFFIDNIRDLNYTEDMDVYLYDWENKVWIDPSTYTVAITMNDGVKIDERDDYETDNVLTSITIIPMSGFTPSRELLIYFGYNKSDIFESIDMNPNKINVRFKPLIVLDKPDEGGNPYYNIKIRKHFDGYEKYACESDDNGEILVKRIRRSGKYTYSPVFRTVDISFTINGNEFDYTDIGALKVKSPFQGYTTQRMFSDLTYTATINQPIDGWIDNENIKLICISNNEHSSYDGNISTVMFTGVTERDGSNNPVIRITDSNLPNYVTGRYICTVLKDGTYDSVGGVVTIVVSHTETDIYGDWVTVPTEHMLHHELPDEFIIVPDSPVTNAECTVILENKYIKEHVDRIDTGNSGVFNPYEYYYDSKNYKRIPISDVRMDNHKQRLVIDQSINPDIKLVKSTYIGICRYSASRIPDNGIIDMTGYLPTPLSRARYEFWVNGRCVSGTNDLIILSPTSIQLRNMKSLRNFECIELVDDVDMDNDIMHQGCVYVDINGNTYSSYKLALLSNSKINQQNMAFIFNANNHSKLNDYTESIVDKPNNFDIEEDLLTSITFDTASLDYNQYTNKPSINGITLLHPKLNHLGLSEIDNMDILKMYDRVWREEATTNPFFMTTHRSESVTSDIITLHVKEILEPHWNDLTIDTTGMFVVHITGPVDKYFSLYVSDLQDGEIDNVTHTKKIIPFVSSSVYILLDSSYKGMWLHSTHPTTKPIHIV